MATFNDFSQLKHLKPAAPKAAPPPPPPPTRDERALAAAGNSSDYFSSLLGGTESRPNVPAKPRRTTIATPATMARVREEQAEDALAAERSAFQSRERELLEEVEAQRAACESLATDLAVLQQQRQEELAAVQAELKTANDQLKAANAKLEAATPELMAAANNELHALQAQLAATQETLAEKDREIARLQALLVEAQRTSLSSSVLLEKPAAFSEKFTGEIREHVIETLAAANEAAEAGGRDRRARILEAVLGANPATDELNRRREAVKQIVKDAGYKLDDDAITALEELGFRYVSGKNHHKLEWAGIRFPIAKTPSDYRACLNSATEICNRVF